VVNKAIIVGNLGRDPDVRFTPSGRAVAKFSVATTERWTDQQGQRQEKTEWHNIVVWGKQAETCGQYLSKGRQVYVEGRITNRSYDDKDGNKRYITEIIARDVRFLGGGGGGGGGASAGRVADPSFAPPAGEDAAPPDTEDDIPF
jgi:single-strand DNA-binding protein